jgi:phosphatidylethanolamine/phosphatidyl-N-methylethanolamine N-methyltransferase
MARVVVPMRGNDPFEFLRGWTRDPVAVGLPIASSFWTARRLAHETLAAALPGNGPVVELGAGTGAITAAFLDAGCPADGLVVVERDPELCATLRERFPGLRIVQGDALALRATLAVAGISSASAVLSGLPMRAIPVEAATRCYADAFALMPPGGSILQYTYGLRPPVDPDEAGLPLGATFVAREWRNVPPMGIWRYRLMQAVPAFEPTAVPAAAPVAAD